MVQVCSGLSHLDFLLLKKQLKCAALVTVKTTLTGPTGLQSFKSHESIEGRVLKKALRVAVDYDNQRY